MRLAPPLPRGPAHILPHQGSLSWPPEMYHSIALPRFSFPHCLLGHSVSSTCLLSVSSHQNAAPGGQKPCLLASLLPLSAPARIRVTLTLTQSFCTHSLALSVLCPTHNAVGNSHPFRAISFSQDAHPPFVTQVKRTLQQPSFCCSICNARVCTPRCSLPSSQALSLKYHPSLVISWFIN